MTQVSAAFRVLILILSVAMLSSCASESTQSGDAKTRSLDYDQMVFLDAETLAEGGIGKAYRSVLPKMRQYVPQAVDIEEILDSRGDRYAVRFREREYVIYSPDLESSDGQSWGRAAHALFTIVNDQMTESPYRFYAIGAGNDLGGLFLTTEQFTAAQNALPRRTDWPYLPVVEHPWYGQKHD